MKTIPLALAAISLSSLAVTASAAPPPGGARHGAGPYKGGAQVRPPPMVRPGYAPAYRPPAYRPGLRPGYYPAYRPGWKAGYWAPRAGWYGRPPYWGYWGAWPYAAAWGFGATAVALSYPYVTTPLVVNTAPPIYIQQEPAAPAPQAEPAAGYWYYCADPAGYFPYVKDCRQSWMKVVPQAPGEQGTPPQLAR